MKINRTFVVLIVVLMAVMLLFETSAPNRFQWNNYSQSYKSKQPFGCYVMDSVLRASLPQGYEVFGQYGERAIDKAIEGDKCTFLFTNSYNDFADYYNVDFLKLIEEGNNVVMATDSYYYSDIDNKLEFSFLSTYRADLSKETLSDLTRIDTVYWVADNRFAPATYLINSGFCQASFNLSNSYRTLATLNEADESYNGVYHSASDESLPLTVAGIRDYGKGKVIVVSMPLIFSNYGILDDNIRPFVLRLLSECGNLPIVRYDPTYIGQASAGRTDSDSPLRYLLSRRPLRWALYLALATLVALVFFSARRRQRVIPVLQPPVNHMMNFVKRIGGIYYKRHDNVDLIIKKYVTFSNDVRVKTLIDIDNYDHIDEELQMLSNRTGIPFDELQKQIYDVWKATNASSISDERLQRLIDMMNNILHKINI